MREVSVLMTCISTTALTVALAAMPANAQTAAVQAMPVGSAPADPQQLKPMSAATVPADHDVAAAHDVSGQIQDIIVTAQRRPENVQKSSLSIQVLSADDIIRNGTTGPRDLNTQVPGLAVSQGGSFTQTFIRGVGDITSNIFGSNGVAYTIDGVVIDRPTSITTNFFDLERVEVLKGPQGTLYGRNSTGGAINLISHRPGDELGGYITAEVGNYDALSVTGAIDLPVSSTLKLRAAFNSVRRNGYLSDGRNDDNRRAGRLSMMWEPSSTISLLVVGDLQHLGGKGPGGVVNPLPAGVDSAWTGPSDPLVIAQLKTVSPIALAPDVSKAFYDGDYRNIMAELNASLGFAKLTVLGGYRYVKAESRTAQPGFDTYLDERAKQASIEARLSNQTDRFKWVVGGIYFNEKQSQVFETFLSDVTPFGRSRQTIPHLPTRSFGIFGEGTYSVTPALRAIGGVRYSDEHKELDGVVTHLGTTSLGAAGTFLVTGREDFSKVTWRAGLEYDVSQRSMIYATVSTGFKAGGFAVVPPPNNTYSPETITSYVAGSRNRFFDNRLQLNLEAFYWKYSDYQASILGPQANGFTGTETVNAGKATIYGLDVDVVAKLSRNDTIRFVGEYLHTEFDEFSFDRTTTGLVAGLTTGCRFVGAPKVSPYGGTVQTLDCSGFPLQRSPKWSGSGSYQHVFPLANGGDVDFKATAGFAASRYISIEYTSLTRAAAYATVDLDLTYHAPANRFSLSGFVRNVGDKAYYTGGVLAPLGGGRLLYQTIGAPRTYGLRATVNF